MSVNGPTTLRLWCSKVDQSGRYWRQDAKCLKHTIDIVLSDEPILDQAMPLIDVSCPVKGCSGVINASTPKPTPAKKTRKKKR